MADQPTFNCSYSGIPFTADQAICVRLNTNESSVVPRVAEDDMQPRKFQPCANLLEEIDRYLPWEYLSDFTPPILYPGRNLGAVAKNHPNSPTATVKPGEFFYPCGAARWGVFRMLATSSLAKAMAAAAFTGGSSAKPLVISALPLLPDNPPDASYSITTPMYMLPPRPLGEGNKEQMLDGLYLVTFVDERYLWQFKPLTLSGQIDQNTTWDSLIQYVAGQLGVSITYSTIEDFYTKPEQDSQLWANAENAGILLDTLAYNVSRLAVRKWDGSYVLQTNDEAEATMDANRGSAASVIRIAGGDMFDETGLLPGDNRLPNNNLAFAKQAVVPSTIQVTFPQYIIGDDPVPHIVNSRYRNQRPSAWYEESYGSVYSVNVPILSGGHSVSGLKGVGQYTMHTTAKALYSGEVQLGLDPLNASGCIALARNLAESYWQSQAQPALDEVYPGIYAWEPEGYDDLLFVWSKARRVQTTRVMRQEWNSVIREFQHATSPLPNYTNTQRGVGGPSVAQTWHDKIGPINTILLFSITASDTSVILNDGQYMPTQNRWVATISSGAPTEEHVLLAGTSGGGAGAVVSVIQRGLPPTIAQAHSAGATVTRNAGMQIPGVNSVLVTQTGFTYPGTGRSGGITEVEYVEPVQFARIISGPSGSGLYDAVIEVWYPASGSWGTKEQIWLRDANA